NIETDLVVDISDFMQKKLEAVFAYDSQFFKPNSNEPATPIATKNFQESIEYRAKDLGRIIGDDYAEGFTVERYIGINSLSALIVKFCQWKLLCILAPLNEEVVVVAQLVRASGWGSESREFENPHPTQKDSEN